MTRQITLQTAAPELIERMILGRKLIKAHMHSMHPANRPNRPAALGPVQSADAEGEAGA